MNHLVASTDTRFTDSLTVLFQRFVPALTFLACVCASMSVLGQQLPTHPIKCANPQALSNPKGKKVLQFSLLTGFRDSLLSTSGRFMIYYDATAIDTDSVTTPAYVQRAAEEADSAYAFEIGDLGYTPPEFTDGSHYIIYLTPFHLNPQFEAYGATFPLEGGHLQNSPSGNERWRTYLVIDNSFTSNIYATHGFDALRITIFHEFFHMTQFSGYGHPPNGIPNYVYFQEMSSVWMEWLSTPTVKDYIQYVGSYLSHLDLRLDLPVDVGEYGEYLYMAYLSRRFDTSIVRQIWEYYRDSSGDPMVCIEQAIEDRGSDFCSEYEEFGWELMQSGWRIGLHGFIPDASLIPIGMIPLHPVPWQFATVALSLQFSSKASCFDTCVAAIARDTDRSLQSNGSVDFPTINSDPTLTADVPAAYCLRKACFGSQEVTSGNVDIFPDPFVANGNDSVYVQASSATNRPVSTVLNVMMLNQNEIRSIKATPILVQSIGCQPSWFATWDGRDDNGNLVQSGEYLYTLHVDGALKVGKIVVVRK